MSKPNMHEITASIKHEARRLGFNLVGVTDPSPPPHLDVYQHWLAAGRHGGMAYLASDHALRRRADPRLILPKCRSILVVAASYLPQDMQQPTGQIEAYVASYALGEDYHNVLVQRLKQLVTFIQALVNKPVPNRIYTDTGPLLERELAQRAGLGWIGKNTCLINPSYGSYFTLAEVLLGIDLEPDAPFQDGFCGTCTRCIDACPTACILPDRTLDAKRCISYLTIEEKGSIPDELRSSIGNWVFGCDVCQQVCPWNVRFASPTNDPAFQPRSFLAPPDIMRFLSLAPEAWTEQLHGSPLLRPKRRGLLRNAAIVAGNAGDLAAVPLLTELLLCDPEPLVRAHAAWALSQIDDAQVYEILKRAKVSEIEQTVISEINTALDSLPSKS